MFGGPKIPRCWERQHEKCHCRTPSCVPQMLVKTRTWEQSLHMLANSRIGRLARIGHPRDSGFDWTLLTKARSHCRLRIRIHHCKEPNIPKIHLRAHANSKSKVPEGHHLRGTTLREALRGNLPLRGVVRGLCMGLSEGSAGLSGVLRGSWDFPKFFRGSDPMHVTLCM